MAILVVYDAVGDPTKLLESYNKAGKDLDGQLPPGTLAHICVPTETGIRTYLVIESEQHAKQALRATEFRAAKGAGRKVVHDHGLVTQKRSVRMQPVWAFSVSTDVRGKATALARSRNGGGGTASGVVAIGERLRKAGVEIG